MTIDTSAEALEALVQRIEHDPHTRADACKTLRALAAEKRRAREGVTDELVADAEAAYSAYYTDASSLGLTASPTEAMRAALEAVLQDGRDAKDWTDEQCIRFMCVGLRHAEYSNGGPTVNEIRQGARAAMKDTDHD